MFENPVLSMIIMTTLSYILDYFLKKYNLAQKIEKTLISSKDFFFRKK